jgi:N-acetylglucosaminyldiphosphoundecaprenol N-acetyl-beta-D-mannosaminyltransferase
LSKNLFSFPFSTLSFADTIRNITDLAQKRVGAYVCVANVHMTVEAIRNPAFGEVLQEADLAILDGMPLCWSFKLLHGFKPDRIAGKHLMHALLLEASVKSLSVLFYGSSREKLELTKSYLISHYPELQIAGMISPPFRPLSFEENKSYADQINASGASLVFVALGCPKQEIWMHTMKAHVHATMLGIGGAMEVLVGIQKRPAPWIENAGLEWLFRLGLEPRRLLKRYLVTNAYFLIFLFNEFLITKFKTPNS